MRDLLIRPAAFVRRELVATLRQPWLLLSLVLGPFLVLFVFGLGYSRDFPTLTTVVVGDEDSELVSRVNDFVAEAEVTGIDYVGTEPDREVALQRLRDDEVDLVVVLPPEDEVGTGERAIIEVHKRSTDPVTGAQVEVAAETAMHEINDQVVAEVLGTVQDQTATLAEDVASARDVIAQVQDAVGADDVDGLLATAETLSVRLDTLADQVGQASRIAALLGIPSSEVEESLRSASEQLASLSRTTPLEDLDELDAMLTEADDAVAALRDADPEVLVRPFDVEVVSDTPVEVTLDRFYAPGLLALMLQHVAVTFAALGLVRERRRGTADVLRVAPITTGQRLVGTTIAHLVLGAAVAAALTALIVTVFGVPVPVDWLQFVGLALLTLLASVGYGYVIASVARTDSQAVQLSMLMLLIAIFFSGLFLPLARINFPVRWVSWAMPTTHAFTGFRELMLLGESVSNFIWAGLSGLAIVLLAAARVLIPWRDSHP
ncbi:MAG TPA: ABC transporter permease [Nitriliruptoraceae bacterium]|nr:ABC transporter permease [Nitriliruptoraceae bacterium]